MVLLMLADSTAVRRCSERFHSVNARAVFTTASQAMMSQPRGEMSGMPSMPMPMKTSTPAPTAMLAAVITRAGTWLSRLTLRPSNAATTLAPSATMAAAMPADVAPRSPAK